MATRSPRRTLAPFDGAQRRFERWRQSRPLGTRIPDDLWDVAVELAAEHGVSKTSSALSLDYYALKKRLAAGADRALVVTPEAEFVEVPFVALPSASGCILELQDDFGVRLRVELSGATADEIEAIARGLWKASR